MARDNNVSRKENGINIRAVALDILLSYEKGEDKSHKLLGAVLNKYDYLSSSDKSFLKRLTEGTVEYSIKLDYIINEFSGTPVSRMKPVIRQVIRMSVYQIMYMDRVPDRAVCDEAVKLVKKRGLGGLSGFVNGVLRAIIRGREDIKWPDPDKDEIPALSVEYSCPEHIVRSLIDDYGRDRAISCLEASLLPDRMTYLRIDESLPEERVKEIRTKIVSDDATSADDAKYSSDATGPEEYITGFISDSDLPDVIRNMFYAAGTVKTDRVMRHKEFAEGLMTVQDISSQLVCELAGFEELGKTEGAEILDVCSAPGGKSMHAASKLKRYGINGSILSLDISDAKQDITKENIRRMHLDDLISADVWDATVFNERFADRFDLVLADVPCSGLGVMGRKADIKYNMTEAVMSDIVTLQHKILDNAVRYVRVGGRIIFSTCTMRRAENDLGVEYILKRGGYRLIRKAQLFLSRYNDGFFIAVLERFT